PLGAAGFLDHEGCTARVPAEVARGRIYIELVGLHLNRPRLFPTVPPELTRTSTVSQNGPIGHGFATDGVGGTHAPHISARRLRGHPWRRRVRQLAIVEPVRP